MRFLVLIRNWIISFLLAGAAVFFSHQTLKVWSSEDTSKDVPAARKPLHLPAVKRTPHRRAPRYKTYEVISEKNLFASDRREQSYEAPEAAPPAMPSKPPGNVLALFGVVINGNEKKALVSNPEKRRGKEEKENIWVTVGDKIGNFEVRMIKPEELILFHGGSAYTVLLSDQSHPEKKAILRKLPKQINTFDKNKIKPTSKRPKVKQ